MGERRPTRERSWISILIVGLFLASSTLALPPAEAISGGPDSYGYIWVNNQAPSPTVTYTWVDIRSRGTRLSLPDDGCTFEVSLGFQFRFYGTITDQVYICSNGFITFSPPDSFNAEPPIPSTQPPNDRVVALGVDLNPAADGSGDVYFLSEPGATPRRFLVTWDAVYKVYTTKPQTFQISLEQNETTKDGQIFLQYQTLNEVDGSLVGIENRTGTSGLTYPLPLGPSLAVGFLPPSDAELPPDTLQVTASILAPATVEQGTINVPLMRLDLSTATNWVDVASLRVVLSGLGAGPEDVTRARLWLDDGDGVFLSGADLLIASSQFIGSPPVASLQPASSLRVSTTASPRLFVSYDIALTAGVGDWVGARLPDPSHVSVLFPDVVGASAFPIDTYAANVRTRIGASRDTLTLTRAMPTLPPNVPQWATDGPALAMTLEANRNRVDLAGLNITVRGNATASDVWLLKAVEDRDGDGNYTPSTDAVLALAAPSGTPPRADLRFTLDVVAGFPRHLLLLVDVAPEAAPGHVLNISLSATDFVLPSGSADIVSGVNLPVWTGDRTVVPGNRPTLRLPWLDPPPIVDGVWLDNEYPTGPENTISLDRPAGNRVAGYVTVGNNATTLNLLVDATGDFATNAGDGIAVGFDVDLDGAPTDNSDDVFAANATGGGHYRYNATAGGWTLVQACTFATVPACATGFGATPLQRISHRFYEFAIPLAGIGAAPGAIVRFAIASPPHFGLADAGNRSTWPLVFGPAVPPLTYFGALALAPGPAPNQSPKLNWTGEPGYETDGLEPDWGFWNATFSWRIVYLDPDDDPPEIMQPLLHIYNNGFDLAISPVSMMQLDPVDRTYVDGKIYVLEFSGLPCGGNYTYSFEVRDARGLRNETGRVVGPLVICPDLPPTLTDDTVSPFVGTARQTVFTYRAAYSDPEGFPPVSIELSVRRGDTLVGSPPLAIAGWVGPMGDFAAGAWFSGTLVLDDPGTNYTFRFRASDGNTTAETTPVLGPYVYPPAPDVLSVAGVDLAPLFVDEGSALVPFLGLLLLTTTDVNVTSIRVDRIGSVGDSEIPAVHMYLDVDASRTITPGDVLLGTRQPVLGTMTFPVTLRVTSSAAVSVLFLVNLTRPGTADGSIGLEVRDASYITVAGGDVVAAFPPYRSTRALINVPPVAASPTVDGSGAGSPGIQHITSSTPTFGWRYADPNGADVTQIAFNVSVVHGAPTSPPIWFRNETGATSAVVYAGPPLTDGETYLLRIVLFDGRLWSTNTQVFFRLNTPPPTPVPLAPEDFATDVNPSVTLLWEPVADAEADTIVYTYWISDNPGFSPTVQGSTLSPGASLSLATATTYYWKVGASDGFEFAGNSTVWRFTTARGGPGPVRGEIRGRVLNGSAPLPQALVEVLAGTEVVAAALTDADGLFSLRDLDLRAYTVRLSAFGFQPTTRTAEPTESTPVVSLGDIGLVPYQPPDGGGGPNEVPATPLLLVLLVLIAVVLSAIMLALSLRRRRAPAVEETRPRKGRTSEPPRPPPDSAAPEGAGEGGASVEGSLFMCPECGREVSVNVTSCECGAVFE